MPGKKKIVYTVYVYLHFRFVITGLLCFFFMAVNAQDVTTHDSTAVHVKDVGDVLRKLFNKKPDTTKSKKQSNVALLPSLGYNPSFGFVFGAKASVIRQFGQKENTDLSTFGLEASYSTKGIITAQARHNVFTAGDKWNLQGNWQLSKFIITDYSIGTGNKNYLTNSDSAFPIQFHHIRFAEKLYRKIGKHLYAGGGVSFNIRYKIEDEKLDSLPSTPHYRYSLRNGFDPKKYSANALLVGMAYNTREHPLRSYGGMYADFMLGFSQKWLGSTKNAIQLILDIRKYISLSNKNPEHVLAFWHLGSYLLDGRVPYLALPATGYDLYNRSGRGYTIGRFKGLSFSYFESEYRFPITRNKLFSGVAFMNVQTASDDLGKNLFQYWDPAAGIGLRILFQKQSRSTVCIDYVRGKYGSQGWFFGLNEVF
ncbi:MAG: BamA/TamA family outer membrane protein [Flavisolibacter sp.]